MDGEYLTKENLIIPGITEQTGRGCLQSSAGGLLFVGWCFESSQPQRITSGLNTNLTLSSSYSCHKSSYHKSCFLSLFIFRGHSTREPASSRVAFTILRAYTGTDVSHSQQRKTVGRGFGKNASEWTGRVEISKENVPGSKRSMYGYIMTYSRL